MALFIITGTMGGGKSYYAADIARKVWNDGGIVHSNIPWNWTKLEELGYAERHIKLPAEVSEWCYKDQETGKIKSDHLIGGVEHQENVVIVDEAAMLPHAYDATESKKKNRTLFDFMVMSRHIGLDIYFISQAASNIDPAIRKVAETITHCVNVARVPFFGPALKWFYGDFRRAVYPAHTRTMLTCSYARLNTKICELYNTHGEEGRVDIERSATRTKKKTFPWKLALGLTACVATSAYGFRDVISRGWDGKKDEQTKTPAPAGGANLPASQSSKEEPKSPLQEEDDVYIIMQTSTTIIDSAGNVYSFEQGKGKQISSLQYEGQCANIELSTGEKIKCKLHKP